MARGSSLSDDRVIDNINRNFIAVDNNISDQGWPVKAPGLNPWHRWLDSHPSYSQNGFTTSVVLSPDGRTALGTSGSGHISEWHTSICYDPQKYFAFLEGSLNKYRGLREIMSVADPNQRAAQLAQFEQQIMMENRSRNNPEAANQ